MMNVKNTEGVNFIKNKGFNLETVLKPKIDNHSLFFAAQK